MIIESLMPNHTNNRKENAFEVEEKTHALDIFAIQAGLGDVIQIIAAIDLRPTSEAWENGIGTVFVALFNQITSIKLR